MGLIKEPLNVDFSMESKPWSEQELRDFRKLMQGIKSKKVKKISKGGKQKAKVF